MTEQIVFCTESGTHPSTSTVHLVRTNFNGTRSKILLEDKALKSIRGLAVDWSTGNIYWSNGQLKRLQLLHPDGLGQKTIVWQNVDPRQIVIDPTNENLFFVDCSGEAKICSIKVSPKAITLQQLELSGLIFLVYA